MTSDYESLLEQIRSGQAAPDGGPVAPAPAPSISGYSDAASRAIAGAQGIAAQRGATFGPISQAPAGSSFTPPGDTTARPMMIPDAAQQQQAQQMAQQYQQQQQQVSQAAQSLGRQQTNTALGGVIAAQEARSAIAPQNPRGDLSFENLQQQRFAREAYQPNMPGQTLPPDPRQPALPDPLSPESRPLSVVVATGPINEIERGWLLSLPVQLRQAYMGAR